MWVKKVLSLYTAELGPSVTQSIIISGRVYCQMLQEVTSHLPWGLGHRGNLGDRQHREDPGKKNSTREIRRCAICIHIYKLNICPSNMAVIASRRLTFYDIIVPLALPGYYTRIFTCQIRLKEDSKYSQQGQRVQHCHQHHEHQRDQQVQHDLSHQAYHEIPKRGNKKVNTNVITEYYAKN